MLKKFAWGLLFSLLLLGLVVAGNTMRKGSRQLEVAPLPKLELDQAAVATRLAEAVRLRTVSAYEDPKANLDQFRSFHTLLQQRFPKVHATLGREFVGELSLLYTWKGSKPDAKPIMLMAHQDVVPIAPGTEKNWQQEPFSGAIEGGYVWGRGSWDNKGNLMSQLEAVETLLNAGYVPERTIYLFFGADEELGGARGAAVAASLFKERRIQLEMVLDEGLLITDGILPGLNKPAALIGLAEKGYVSVVMKFTTAPGHSSQPPAKGTSAIGMMSAAIKRLDDNQLPAGIRGVAAEMFDTLAPEMSGFGRVALSNLWLFGPLVQKQLEAGAATNAMLRTTTAPTIAHAGNKDNVLPGVAEATVNFRILPGETRESVMAHVQAEVGQVAPKEKYELYVMPNHSSEPSKVAPSTSAQYQLMSTTVREVFPGVLVAPGLMIAGTDSKYFAEVSDHIFKFSPVVAKPEDLPRFHGTNERIAINNYADAIRFYHRLISEGAKAPKN
jgi:carboxypeptidase PM20D1